MHRILHGYGHVVVAVLWQRSDTPESPATTAWECLSHMLPTAERSTLRPFCPFVIIKNGPIYVAGLAQVAASRFASETGGGRVGDLTSQSASPSLSDARNESRSFDFTPLPLRIILGGRKREKNIVSLPSSGRSYEDQLISINAARKS
ncbi:uncharacterized protein PADG_01380 [Paracoccidioides brasiliensis Pb18]|uniref:Uncharacterized protein n=1 Tax=Paracoccidioides brasiliensis (strain Pb18) TaxID=502780 RepID=C1G364_PARBD|nr:uncharacterized protein PADG_01380 [Paracoccidioides brasiliensis Pb18]EEH45230.2 hypothetical protein PADG_01380 [Paracoccidioides brasiliensis Pb18]